MEIKVIQDQLFVDRWVYPKPRLTPDKNGNIVMIEKMSFGPLEVYEWGIDSEGKPYEMYKWCEDDYYSDENYTKKIAFSELFNVIDKMVKLTADNGLSDWARLYKEARVFCEKQNGGVENGRSLGNSE